MPESCFGAIFSCPSSESFSFGKRGSRRQFKRLVKSLRHLLIAALFALPVRLGAQSVISNTVIVPLHYKTIASGGQKLGIYASLGGGSTPQIFEFDTGGGGFYAAYASADTNKSRWWGTNFSYTGSDVTNTYDSGIQYQGAIVTASVSLFSDHNSSSPLVTTAGDLRVGQMTSITNTTSGGAALWTPGGEGTTNTPPVDEAFYGDFGMNLAYTHSGIVNLIAQLSFTNGIAPGFRIRAYGDSPYMQIGLTAADTNSASAFYFGMNADTNAPPGSTFTNSRSLFYSEQVFNANMTISNATTNFTTNLGITTDTGASTTIHNADVGGIPEALYTTNSEGKGHLVAGADFGLSGMTLGGTNSEFFEFVTTAGQVSVQDNKTNNTLFYLNSGISLFQQYDVIYNLQDGQIGFEAVPEPRTWALLALGGLLLALASVRRRAS
ncbi:MAG: PEP-CTERM sorting domain-containing protein [Chthoniobacterales bacterium]|nr:PEP-CTERM sorting domain-containing protein [Chthoniobacterales bacterium]